MKSINNKVIFSLFYLSLLAGYYFNENLNFGSYYDWVNVYVFPITSFSNNFLDTFFNYDQLGQRHSPIFLMFLSIFVKIGISFDVIRLVNLHLSLSLIFVFYNSLKIVFKRISKDKLQLLSFIIFLSPTFRSLAIWPDSRLPGLIFFIISIYFFLKFIKNSKMKNAWLCSISLLTSSYISPNFCVFSIYFYSYFFFKMNFKNFIKIILFNFFVSLPMFYYVFILDVNFLTAGNTPGSFNEVSRNIDFNLSNKILIISTIIFFHSVPIIFSQFNFNKSLEFYKKNILQILVILSLLIYFFNYDLQFTGGGVFFQFSQIYLNNNYLFYFIAFFSISLIYETSIRSFHNLFLIIIIIISNVQNTIYHKYYEPMIIILIFLLLRNLDFEKFFKNKSNLIILYLFSLSYIFLRSYKNFFLV